MATVTGWIPTQRRRWSFGFGGTSEAIRKDETPMVGTLEWELS